MSVIASDSRAYSIYGRRGLGPRVVYLACALVWWLTGCLLGRVGSRGVIVLCYHSVSELQQRGFRRQMQRIARQSTPLPTESAEWVRPRIHVTFDDAFACLQDNAIPVLRRMQIPYTIFVVSGCQGTVPNWKMPNDHPEAALRTMTPAEISRVRGDGLCRVGSHTASHPDLSRMTGPELARELRDSRLAIEESLGGRIEDVAFPYGAYNEEVVRAALDAGYQRLYTLDPWPVRVAACRPIIGRFSMSPDVWQIEFVLTCAGAYSYLYHWRRFLRRIRSRLFRRRDH